MKDRLDYLAMRVDFPLVERSRLVRRRRDDRAQVPKCHDRGSRRQRVPIGALELDDAVEHQATHERTSHGAPASIRCRRLLAAGSK